MTPYMKKTINEYAILLVICALLGVLVVYCPAQVQSTASMKSESAVIKTLEREMMKDRPDRAIAIPAIRQLGEMHSVRAIPLLIRALDLSASADYDVQEFAPKTRFDIYPATRALFQIGQPAVSALLAVVTNEEFAKERSASARFTLFELFMSDQKTLHTLYEARAVAATEAQRVRLRQAEEEVDRLAALVGKRQG
jgi:hypothetical protein